MCQYCRPEDRYSSISEDSLKRIRAENQLHLSNSILDEIENNGSIKNWILSNYKKYEKKDGITQDITLAAQLWCAYQRGSIYKDACNVESWISSLVIIYLFELASDEKLDEIVVFNDDWDGNKILHTSGDKKEISVPGGIMVDRMATGELDLPGDLPPLRRPLRRAKAKKKKKVGKKYGSKKK